MVHGEPVGARRRGRDCSRCAGDSGARQIIFGGWGIAGGARAIVRSGAGEAGGSGTDAGAGGGEEGIAVSVSGTDLPAAGGFRLCALGLVIGSKVKTRQADESV